jgi:hypothetical protein
MLRHVPLVHSEQGRQDTLKPRVLFAAMLFRLQLALGHRWMILPRAGMLPRALMT